MTRLALISLTAVFLSLAAAPASAQDAPRGDDQPKPLKKLEPGDGAGEEVRARLDEIRGELRRLDEQRAELRRELAALQRQNPRDVRRPMGLSPIELDRDFDDFFGGFTMPRIQMHLGQSPLVGGSRVEVTRDADGGVRIRIEEKDADTGETKEEIYEAESMEAFREKHPEVAERYKIGAIDLDGGQFHFDFGNGSGFLRQHADDDLRHRLDEFFQRFDIDDFGNRLNFGHGGTLPQLRAAPPVAPRAKLGVHVRSTTPQESANLGLLDGEGLVVESVIPGSLAAALGIVGGDVLTSINGKSIAGTDIIAEELNRTGDAERVTVEVHRRGEGILTLDATRNTALKPSKKI